MKKILCLLITAFMIIMLIPAYAIERSDYGLYVGGIPVTKGNANDIDSSGKVSLEESDDHYTLILNGYTYDGTGSEFEYGGKKCSAAICYTGDVPLLVILAGTNSIHHVSGSEYDLSAAIFSTQGITFIGNIGDNDLSLTGGSPENENSESYGIYCSGSVNFGNGAQISASGGEAKGISAGIRGNNVRFEITREGTVTANGGDAGNSYGIYSDTNIFIPGGSVKAVGGKAADKGESIGAYAKNSIDLAKPIGTKKSWLTASGETQAVKSGGISRYHGMGIIPSNGIDVKEKVRHIVNQSVNELKQYKWIAIHECMDVISYYTNETYEFQEGNKEYPDYIIGISYCESECCVEAEVVQIVYSDQEHGRQLTYGDGVSFGFNLSASNYEKGYAPSYNPVTIIGYTSADGSVDYGNTQPVNAGKYYALYKTEGVPKDTVGKVFFEILKADPVVTAPAGLTAVTGKKLSDVKIPNAENGTWTWKEPDTVISKTGDQQFKATFTPTDAVNYNSKENVDITVSVKYAAPDQDKLTDEEKPSANDLSDNGSDQKLVTDPKSLPEGYTDVQYSLDGKKWTGDPPAGNAAEDYSVYVRYIGDSEHEDFELAEPVKVTIRPVYTVTEGGDGTWTKGSGEPYGITVKRSSNDDTCFDHFVSVLIDNELLSDGFAARKGSTVVTIAAETLEELEEGRHTVTVNFDDGRAEAVLLVEKDTVPPATGDNSGIWVWITAISFTALGLCVLTMKGRKHGFN